MKDYKYVVTSMVEKDCYGGSWSAPKFVGQVLHNGWYVETEDKAIELATRLAKENNMPFHISEIVTIVSPTVSIRDRVNDCPTCGGSGIGNPIGWNGNRPLVLCLRCMGSGCV